MENVSNDWGRIHNQKLIEALLALRLIRCLKIRQQQAIHIGLTDPVPGPSFWTGE